MSRVPAGTFMHQPVIETDVIGGFTIVDPNCRGCGQPLTIDNAWMADGCPCNSAGWNNSMNETRWRLLMQLQQRQNFEIAELRAQVAAYLDAGGMEVTQHARGGITITGPQSWWPLVMSYWSYPCDQGAEEMQVPALLQILRCQATSRFCRALLPYEELSVAVWLQGLHES